MEYESVQQTANRLNINVRTVQKWAKDGKLPGAKQVGRAWLIPTDVKGPVALTKDDSIKHNHIPMPFLNSSFEPGQSMSCIEAIEDENEREIARAEYYYFSGQAVEASKAVELYLDHTDLALALSASLIYSFSNISLGRTHLTHFGLEYVKKYTEAAMRSKDNPELQAIAVFIATAATVLLHIPVPALPPLEGVLGYLPEGLKLFASYIMAHDAYLKKEYSRSLGIADMALAFYSKTYPVATIYLQLVACMDLMSLKRAGEAEARFIKAWELAYSDGLIEALGEHHGLLQGILERCLKKQYPDDFKRIISITYSFSSGWRRVHKFVTKHSVADNLTTTEFTVAMLFNRGWTVKEIAAHMEMSERMIKHYISMVYEKLGITNREELEQYMLA